MVEPKEEGKHDFEALSRTVIGACIDVQRALGLHCMEVDYQRALEVALAKPGIACEREVGVAIVYEDVVVTKRRVDFVVSDDHDTMIIIP